MSLPTVSAEYLVAFSFIFRLFVNFVRGSGIYFLEVIEIFGENPVFFLRQQQELRGS